jgi:transposase
MPRFKPTNREQGIMIPISYEKQITTGTFEHAIDYLVENNIKMGIFEARYKNDKTGASAYSPKVLLKIVLLAYSRGIVTSREIEQACRENIVFMALSGGQAPDFTTIADFVSSMKEEIGQIFLDILLICSELDLLGGTEFAIDGCKMSSNASKEWSGTFSDLKKKKEKLEETIKFLIEKHNEADINHKKPDNDEEKRRKKQIDRIEKKAKKIEKFLQENEPKINKKAKRENQSNITDNESAKMKTSHGVQQGYNGMAIADNKHQVIVKAESFGSGQEHELLQPMIEGAKDNAKAIGLGEEYFKEKRIIGDTGSYSLENLKYLSAENIDGYIPDQNFRQRDPRFKGRGRHRPDKKTLYIAEDFIYRKETNDFVCPEENILKYKHKRKVKNTSGKVYYAREEDCSKCTQRKKCLLKDNTKCRTIYIVDEYSGRNYTEEMKAKIDKPEGRDIYSRRMGIIEPVFGNIRNAKRLNRFTLRTKNKVNIQWMLFCIIHNIEKIYKYGIYERLIEV